MNGYGYYETQLQYETEFFKNLSHLCYNDVDFNKITGGMDAVRKNAYPMDIIQKCCAEHRAGKATPEIMRESHVPRSTLYRWFAKYRQLPTEAIPAKKELENLRRKQARTEQICQVLQAVNCTVSAPLREKLYELEKLVGRFPVRILCEALQVDRGTFYNHIKRNKKENTLYTQRRRELSVAIQGIFEETQGLFGSDKILSVLQEQGYHTSKKMVLELMKNMGLRSFRSTAKSDYKKRQKLYGTPNVLNRQFSVNRPNAAWVGDCTQFEVQNKKYHICAILDLYSRKIIAYKIASRASTQLVTSTFKLALEERHPCQNLLFHSDRGCQYTSQAFRKLLAQHDVTQSFSKAGTPYDNSVMESFFSSLKQEELYRNSYSSERDFKKKVAAYVAFYNKKRPHRANQYKTPDHMEANFFSITPMSMVRGSDSVPEKV